MKDEYGKIAREPKVPKAVNPLIEFLFGKPIVSIPELAASTELAFPTVQRGVDYLIGKGKLREMTGQQRNRLFVADEILDVIMTERTKSISIVED